MRRAPRRRWRSTGRIEARNVWLAARSSVAGVGGDIHVAAGSALSAVGVASLLAGNNLYVAAPSNGQPGGLISAGQRMNLRVDRDDRGAYGKASAITIDAACWRRKSSSTAARPAPTPSASARPPTLAARWTATAC